MGFLRGLTNAFKASKGDTQAMIEQAEFFLKHGNLEAAYQNYHSAAAKGDPRGMVKWGAYLMNQAQVPLDVFGGFVWIAKGAATNPIFAGTVEQAMMHPSMGVLFDMNENELQTMLAMFLSHPTRQADAMDKHMAINLIKSINTTREVV